MSKAKSRSEIASVVLLIVLAVILLPILAINLTLIIKGSIDPDTPPSVFGIAPLAVTSGSMEGDEEGSFPKGSLIFVRILDDDARSSLGENDVITFRTADSFVTHRIVGVLRGDDGETPRGRDCGNERDALRHFAGKRGGRRGAGRAGGGGRI